MTPPRPRPARPRPGVRTGRQTGTGGRAIDGGGETPPRGHGGRLGASGAATHGSAVEADGTVGPMGTHEPVVRESDPGLALFPAASGPATLGAPAHAPLSVVALQRAAGNAAVARLLATGVQRQPAPAAPAAAPPGPAVTPVAQVKHTLTIPDKKLGGAKDLGYAQAQFKVGGVLDLEVTPRQGAPAAPATPAAPAAPGADGGGGGVTIKGAGGVNATEDGGKYQAEVTVEFEKRVGGILDGCTPKAKVGGEVGGDSAKLGLEVSLEGQTFEPKFGLTIVDINKEDGIKFATLEAGVDWKIKEFSHTASDGAEIKVTPKATVKVEISPNYTRIATALAEGGVEGAASVAAEAALVAGPPLLAAIVIAQGIYMAGEKGELHRRILEGAVDARQAAMSYSQVMTGSEQKAAGPRATAAVARAQGQLAGIAAANKVPVEALMAELRKNSPRDFVRIHSQARQEVFSAYYSEIGKVIGAWRKEHYILAMWTEQAGDVQEARKQVEVVFSH